jgi:hypothetical protein
VHKATEKIDKPIQRKTRTRFYIYLIVDLDLTSVIHANELLREFWPRALQIVWHMAGVASITEFNNLNTIWYMDADVK